MLRYIINLFLIGFLFGKTISDIDYIFNNQILKLQKDQNVIIIKPNQKIFINGSLMIFQSVDYKNKLIKIDKANTSELKLDSIRSFRYQKSNILSGLDKAIYYKNIGCKFGCLYGAYAAYEILSNPNDVFAITKIFVPVYLVIFSGFGGVVGGVAGGFIGYIYPEFSDEMIIDEGEWEIITPELNSFPI